MYFRSCSSVPNTCNVTIYSYLIKMDAKNKRNLFCKATFRPFGPCSSLWMELTHSSCRVLHVPLLDFMRFLSVYFCSLSRSLSERAPLPLCTDQSPTLLLPGFLIRALNDICLSVDPWGMLLLADWQMVSAIGCHPLSLVVQPVSHPLYSTYPDFIFLVCLGGWSGRLWEAVS